MPNFEPAYLNDIMTDLHATKCMRYIESLSLWGYAYHGMKRNIGGERRGQS